MDRDGRDIIQCVCATDLCNMPLQDDGIARSTVDSSAHLSHLIIAYLLWVQIVLLMKWLSMIKLTFYYSSTIYCSRQEKLKIWFKFSLIRQLSSWRDCLPRAFFKSKLLKSLMNFFGCFESNQEKGSDVANIFLYIEFRTNDRTHLSYLTLDD